MSTEYKEIMEDAERLHKLVEWIYARSQNAWMGLRAMSREWGQEVSPEIIEEYQETTVIESCVKARDSVTSLVGRLASLLDEDDGGELPRRDMAAREMYAMLKRIADKNAEPNGRDVQLASGIADDIWELLGEAKEYFGDECKGDDK